MFALHSQINWGVFSIHAPYSRPRCTSPCIMTTCCVVMCFLTALLPSVQKWCITRKSQYNSYLYLLAMAFIFTKDRGLALLTFEFSQYITWTKVNLHKCCMINNWVDPWDEWKVLPTEEVEEDGLTDEVSTMGKEDKGMRTVLRACVHEMEKVDFTVACLDSQNNQLIFPFKYCSFVVVWFDFALAFAFVLLLPVARRSQIWVPSWSCLFPVAVGNCFTYMCLWPRD